MFLFPMVMISADVLESHFLFQLCLRHTAAAIMYAPSIKHARGGAQTLSRPRLQHVPYIS